MFESTPNLSVNTVAEIVRLALAPVFLLSGIGAFLNVLASRLSRIVDRSRDIEPMLTLLAGLLATVLRVELDREREQRRAERAEVAAGSDALTGLANRRTWDVVLGAEETVMHEAGRLITDTITWHLERSVRSLHYVER